MTTTQKVGVFKKPGLFIGMLFALLIMVQPVALNANVTFIHDNFSSLYLKPDTRAKWWLINWAGQNNQPVRTEDYCGLASCIKAMKENFSTFVRLSTFPGSQSGFFVNADMAELHTGFPSQGTGTWTPSYHHPIVLETRVRWGAQYKQDGTGAVGSNGIWLWNSPYNFENYDPGATLSAIGFNWAEFDTAGGYLGGLKVLALDGNFPVYINKPTHAVNLQSWTPFALIWSEDANGVQSVQYYLDGENLGTVQLPRRLTNLSLETWNDNENGQIGADGSLSITYMDIPSTQNFDVNEINLVQL
ncbi:MAG: hypothetical protein ACMG57_00065 [Candidatus Dojkabacteria bacterium]